MRGWQKGITTLALLLAASSPAAATSPDPAKIEALVRQLGGTQYAAREAARKALEALGVPALDSLRKAVRTGDLELKRRAQALVTIIEKRAETAEFLKPTMVQLNFKDAPILDAVRDFNKQCPKNPGFPDPIVVWGVDKKRTITLTTPPMTYWEAVEKLCEKAELTHVIGGGTADGLLITPGQPLTPARDIGNLQSLLMDNNFLKDYQSRAKFQPRFASTYYSGAVRFRAYPSITATAKGGQAVLTLEIMLEPKILTWYQQTEVKVTAKFDDKGQVFSQIYALEKTREPGFQEFEAPTDFRLGKGLRLVEIPLELPNQQCNTVKSLKGTIVVRVESQERPLLTVENIAKAGNKTFQVTDDMKMMIEKINPLDGGAMRIDYSMEPWSIGGLRPLDNGVQMQLDRHRFVLQVFDTHGKVLPLSETFKTDGGWQATFAPASKEGIPSKMTIRGSHVTTIEIPFEFKDVPLR